MNSTNDAPAIPLNFIEHVARLSGQALSRAHLDDIIEATGIGHIAPGQALSAFVSAWQAGRLHRSPQPLPTPGQHDCPFVAHHAQMGWLAVVSQNADGSWVAQNGTGEKLLVESLDDCECITIPGKVAHEKRKNKSWHLVWRSLFRHRPLLAEAMLATLLVNVLTLSTSLYSMQVYDRVIPNNGFSTLYVLSAGVFMMVLLELLLKHVRSHMLDRMATEIDGELSGWFFRRALGIRLESRPASVGTLASQIRGFELIRGVLSSTTIFALTDVPFALFFIVVILMIGGWMALIPLLLLPIALVAGLVFQRQILRSTRENQGQSNRKAGLLVESIDGAESLKANGAEWKLQVRWNQLVSEAGESDEKVRHYSTLSQHITVALQQLGYIGMIALGAYLVTQHLLTMGALIACSIISNRALMPITQLPAMMIQIMQAKVAADGLDSLIGLPNEIDDVRSGMIPALIEGSLRFDQARFGYGKRDRVALEIPHLEIRPGERVGILGTVGSGKSTLLKLASGLYRPSEGRVFLGDLDMKMIAPKILRENIAYLPQDMRLISGTLRENLLQGLPDPGDDVILETARKTGLIDLIANHPNGLSLPITEGGRGISGGQLQLICLTRMVLAKPSVYILDEPTASMDAATEAKVVALLGELAANGATLLVATHKTALLPIIDRLLVIQHGKFIIDGPRDMVLAKLAGLNKEAANTPDKTSASQPIAQPA